MAIDKSQTPGWLVMLYIAADDVDGHETFDGSIYDECDKMLGNLGRMLPNEDIHLVALFDAKQGATPCARILEKGPGTEDYLLDITERVIDEKGALAARFHGAGGQRAVDTGSRETLATFIRWAIQKHPVDKRMLSVIGHGCGWSTAADDPAKGAGSPSGSPNRMGLCPDLTTRNAISTTDLREALEIGLSGSTTAEANRALDLLFLDACLMGMFEVIYEISDQVKYVVAGQDYLYTGLPYQHYVEGLRAATTPQQLATDLVEKYNMSDPGKGIFTRQNAWSIAAIETSSINGLAAAINNLADALLKIIDYDGVRKAIEHAYNASQKFNYDMLDEIDRQRESYIDLFDFAINLAGQMLVVIEINKANTDAVKAIREVINLAENVAKRVGDQYRTSEEIREDGKKEPRDPNVRFKGEEAEKHIVKPGDPGQVERFSPAVIKAHTQSFTKKPDSSLRNAYGLSIYFPLNKEGVRLDDYRDVNSLKFARTSAQWGALLAELQNKDGLMPTVSKIEETRAPRNLCLKRQQLP